jgi:hypothetical protein
MLRSSEIRDVEAAEIEGDSLRLFVRCGPFGLLRCTRAYHPPNDRWHHVELHRDRTAVVIFKDGCKDKID